MNDDHIFGDWEEVLREVREEAEDVGSESDEEMGRTYSESVVTEEDTREWSDDEQDMDDDQETVENAEPEPGEMTEFLGDIIESYRYSRESSNNNVEQPLGIKNRDGEPVAVADYAAPQSARGNIASELVHLLRS